MTYWKKHISLITHVFTVVAIIAGFFVWSNESQTAEAQIADIREDQTELKYYQDLVYVVNEMENQVKDVQSLSGKEQLDYVKKGTKHVEQLIKPLQYPPEYFSVSYMIADDLYQLYTTYMANLDPGVIEQFETEYENFQRNYELLQTFSQFEAIDILCH